MPDTELDFRLCDSGYGALCIGSRRAKRLFAKHMTAGFGCGLYLCGVAILRSAEDNGVNIGACQRILEASGCLES